MKCPSCGSESWIDGVAGEARGSAMTFRPRESKFLVLSYPEIAAKACGVCGSVALSVDIEKLKNTLKD